MKTIHLFAFCEAELDLDVIWYRVMVGSSQRDRQAHAAIVAKAKADNRIFYARYTAEVVHFMEQVAASLIPITESSVMAVSLLRSEYIAVTELARHLRSLPLSLLNSKAKICPLQSSAAMREAGLRPERRKTLHAI